MLRTMSGSEEHLDIESGQWAELLSRIDGDLYWNYSDPRRPWGNSYMYAHFDGERRAEDLANVAGNGMMLRALLTRRELIGDASLDGYIRRLVGGLRRIAIHRRDYSYYPDGGFGEPFNFPRSGWVSSARADGGDGGWRGQRDQLSGHAAVGPGALVPGERRRAGVGSRRPAGAFLHGAQILGRGSGSPGRLCRAPHPDRHQPPRPRMRGRPRVGTLVQPRSRACLDPACPARLRRRYRGRADTGVRTPRLRVHA